MSCFYCGGDGEPDGLRPYAPGGADTCHPCAVLPENESTVRANMDAVLAQAASITGLVKFTDRGPEPIISVDDLDEYTKDGAHVYTAQMPLAEEPQR